jgi:hypothetical protein
VKAVLPDLQGREIFPPKYDRAEMPMKIYKKKLLTNKITAESFNKQSRR